MVRRTFVVLLQLTLLAAVMGCKAGCSYCDSSQNVCYACSDPSSKLIADGTCLAVSKPIDNCLVYNADSSCSRCAITYLLKGGGCVKDQTGCIRYSSNGGCTECSFGTTLSGGSCSGIVNCQEYPAGGRSTCQTCFNGFLSIGSSCLVLEACQNVLNNSGCGACSSGYNLSGFVCVRSGNPPIVGCAVMTPMQGCQYCLDGYQLDGNGTCVQSNGAAIASITSTTVTTTVTNQMVPAAVASATQQSFASSGAMTGSQQNGVNAGAGQGGQGALVLSLNAAPLPLASPQVMNTGQTNNNNFNGGDFSSFGSSGAAPPQPQQTLQMSTTTTTVTASLASPGGANQNCNLTDDSSGKCLRCLYGFYLDRNSNCVAVSPLCQGYNLENGQCLGCIEGYTLQNGVCNKNLLSDPNCNIPSATGCVSCKYNFYLAAGSCKAVSPLCFGYDLTNGQCLGCIDGYTLSSGGICSQSGGAQTTQIQPPQQPQTPVLPQQPQLPQSQQMDANCANPAPQGQCRQCTPGFYLFNTICTRIPIVNCQQFSNGQCTVCSNSFFLSNGQCTQSQANCQTFNNNGLCASCAFGFSLAADGYCQVTNCAQSSRGSCQSCVQGFYLDQLSAKCLNIPVANCINFFNGNCVGCANGFQLQNGGCSSMPNIASYPNCQQVGPAGCIACTQGYTAVNGNCRQLPPFCQSADSNGNCNGCQPGYTLVAGGSCVSAVSVANCRVVTANGCRECSSGYWLNGQTCQQVSNQCATFNSLNGFCTSCYQGYQLDQTTGQCSPAQNRDRNCQQFAPDGNCIKCFSGYFLNPNRQCIMQNNLCATINPQTGECTSCYQGYQLNAGNCTIRLSDPNCKSFNQDGSCRECSASFYFNGAKCLRVNPLCASINQQTGECTSCYQGYILNNGNCTIGSSVAVANCRTVLNGICQSCSAGFFRAPNNTCQQISPLCATADQNTGACLSCYNGYSLQNGGCSLSAAIANCRQIANNNCLACSTGYFLQNGGCTQINPLCATADQNSGACTSCYQGYALNNGQCVVGVQNSNCRQVRNGQCIQCSQGYMMISGNCVVVNPLCRTVDAATAGCTTCYPGYVLASGNCIIPQNNDPNCIQKSGSTCLYCQNGYWLSNNVCTLLTRKCQNYDQQTGSCTSCVNPLRLVDGDCVGSPTSSDPNCVTANPQGQCTACIPGYAITRGICTAVSFLCIDFDYTRNVCTSCQQGYVLQDGDCIFPSLGVDPYCTRYSGSFCTTCQSRYYLKDYVCMAVDSNCSDFDAQAGVCRACQFGRPQGAGCIS